MKAITIRQPWAGLIITGQKTIEIRPTKINHKGSLAIHVSKTIDWKAVRAIQLSNLHSQNRERIILTNFPLGTIIGTVNIYDQFEFDQDLFRHMLFRHKYMFNWDKKKHRIGWEFKDPKEFNTPIPWRGMLGLFDVPDSIIEKGLAGERR